MNRIRLNRLFLAGLATFLAFVVIEIIWEKLLGALFMGDIMAVLQSYPDPAQWTVRNQVINLGIALGNCFMMIWLYASLRPMFGVGPRTALIASAFVFVFVFAFELNYANLDFFPFHLAVLEAVNLIVELPLALVAGAQVYESGRWVTAEA
jgi:divalent metal cation (Fe/Co/Zn/Cd) transporter